MKKNIFITLLIIAGFILLPNIASTEEEAAGEEMHLYVGEAKIIPVSNPSRIVISNPNVADVSSVTREEIAITPKAPGSTSFVFWDSFGENSYLIRVFLEDMTQAKRRIDNLLSRLNLPEVYTKAEDEENKVLLLGRVKIPEDREKINLALGPLKDKAIDLIEVKEDEGVVEIDVQVLELDQGATSTLGFSWPGSVTIATDQAGGGSAMATVVTAPAKWSTFFDVTKLSRLSFEWKLDALIQEGKARILSRPRLTCQSGKEAELFVGGEKPIFTTTVAATTGSSGTQVEYKEYGIKLNIKPRISEDERIKVSLNVEVSELESTTPETIGSATSPTAKAYPLTKRNASTELFLNDNQTLSIGGLIKQKTSEELRKFPWLADLPVLGVFFRQRATSKGGGYNVKGDTELFITLTPRIVSSKKEPAKAAKTTTITLHKNTGQIMVPENLTSYASLIQSRILDRLTYPKSAKSASFQGTVALSLHLSFRGELLEAQVKSSSGYKILDENALSVVKAISTFPPFPAAIEQKELWLDIPITYSLD